MATLLPGKAHLARQADGGLLCLAVPIARSGGMAYAASELGLPGGEQRVTVWREPEEVTDRRFLTSCESATVTDHHPSSFVGPQNYSWLNRGHMRNVRVETTDAQGNVTVLADVFIKDGDLAERVERGEVRDVSLGYNLELVSGRKGRWFQKNLLANHLAVVERGRAGSTKILDAAPRRSLAAMAADYLGQPIGSVKSRAFDSEETKMPENKWKCECGNINHPAAEDCAACGAAYDEADLEPLEQTMPEHVSRDEALRWLQGIKPQVLRRGNNLQKQSWNALYTAIRDGQSPALALRDVREKARRDGLIACDSDRPETFEQICDRRSRELRSGKLMTAEDAQRAVAEDFVQTCASYLGQDPNEVAAKRRERTVRRALADAKTPAAGLVATCEAYLGATDIHEVERKLRNRD